MGKKDNTQTEENSNLVMKAVKATKIIVYFRDSDGVEGYKLEKDINIDTMSKDDIEVIMKTTRILSEYGNK